MRRRLHPHAIIVAIVVAKVLLLLLRIVLNVSSVIVVFKVLHLEVVRGEETELVGAALILRLVSRVLHMLRLLWWILRCLLHVELK